MILLAQEERVIRGQLVDDQLDLGVILVGKQMVGEGMEIPVSALAQRMRQTAGNELPFFAQIHPVFLLHKFYHPVKIGV